MLLLPTFLGALSLVFALIHLIPGDPVEAMLGETATAADKEAMRQSLGFDRPLLVQYQSFLVNLAAGDLGRIVRIVKLLGFVNAVPTFSDHPKVVNGCSDLFAAVFDTIGGHARSAIGVGSLPGNITVEIEAVVEIAV